MSRHRRRHSINLGLLPGYKAELEKISLAMARLTENLNSGNYSKHLGDDYVKAWKALAKRAVELEDEIEYLTYPWAGRRIRH